MLTIQVRQKVKELLLADQRFRQPHAPLDNKMAPKVDRYFRLLFKGPKSLAPLYRQVYGIQDAHLNAYLSQGICSLLEFGPSSSAPGQTLALEALAQGEVPAFVNLDLAKPSAKTQVSTLTVVSEAFAQAIPPVQAAVKPTSAPFFEGLWSGLKGLLSSFFPQKVNPPVVVRTPKEEMAARANQAELVEHFKDIQHTVHPLGFVAPPVVPTNNALPAANDDLPGRVIPLIRAR